MKHRLSKTINIRSRLNVAAEQLRRRIAHRSNCRHALFFLLTDRTGDTEIDQHNAARVSVKHYVRRLKITVHDSRRLVVEVLENVRDLDRPLSDALFIEPSFGGGTQSRCEIAARDVFHDEIKASLVGVVKIIVDG